MHTDEAVHAVKFGTLLERGEYRYDPNEYHGPTLNYFTLIPAALTSQRTFVELDEVTLRIVPAVFGVGLLVLPFLLRKGVPVPFGFGAVLAAFSPVMGYYSRYYIQESLLVFFSFGLLLAVYRHSQTGHPFSAVGAGLCAGLMHATKETSLITFGVLLAAVLVTRMVCGRTGAAFPLPRGRNLIIVVVTAAATSIALFSSFGSNWQGVIDSIVTYHTYISRAGADAGHEHPWSYYVELLTWWDGGGGVVWSEGPVLLLAVLGGVWALRAVGRGSEDGPIFVLITVYSMLLWCVYSAMPYKTPWSILSAYHGTIMMAGLGCSVILAWLKRRRLVMLGALLVAGVVVVLGVQTVRANFILEDEPVNPWAYAHPGKDVLALASSVERVARAATGGKPAAVQVICTGDEYWPLPWYLRSLPQVGWWDRVGENFVPTPVVLVSPELEPDLVRRLSTEAPPGQATLYVSLFDRPMFLRPGKELRGYVALEFLERAGRYQGR
jgi:uncharacterized protein (TIGR03663 family)